ncbi:MULTISPECIES: low affinity iron permease family protein [Methylobacterium]|uniref:low affinity iron permease family protein n=1 Tax=Methylobacterium TaxID=407 RepID=UPI00104EB9BB|nr:MULTISPECIES: low affinity iron permease family protein [Methylobacterium]MDR7035770.1 low affinity Fe/Cu permease [Methylobacterium sp. BE186]
MTPGRHFTEFASHVARGAGKPITFALSILVIFAWAVTGPLFHYSDTWQLIINTGTTIVTFLMVFLIQNTQNRDGAAIQAKLDELIRVSAAQNRYIGIESLTEEELDALRSRCASRATTEPCETVEAAQAAEQRADAKARDAARRAGGMPHYPA